MPRPIGMLLIAATALLAGVYAWFALVWLISSGIKLTGAHALDGVLLLLAPHLGGWLFALLLGVVAFIVGLRLARRHGVGWLGFASAPDPAGAGAAGGASAPPRTADH